jgi:hypothetical protein
VFLGFHRDTKAKDTFDNTNTMLKYITPKIKNIMWGGLFAYIIHKSYAKTMLLDIKNNGLVEPIDTYVLARDGKEYIHLPLLVTSPCMTFYNLTDSDIQYDLLSIYDDWVFFQYKDSPGNDIKWIKAMTFEELKEKAEAEPNCIAFNTYAWLKYDILQPTNFITMPGIDSNAHGIYVKKSKLVEMMNK